jgi:hypothetical protein
VALLLVLAIAGAAVGMMLAGQSNDQAADSGEQYEYVY